MKFWCWTWALVGVALAPWTATPAEFSSRWYDEPDRIWLGGDYWANPLSDWQVRGGRLECIQGGLHQGRDRNVHLLTWQVTPRTSLRMRVTVGRLSPDVQGWAGFRLGSHDGIDDYRHSCIYGHGLDAGIRTNGQLFIGDRQSPATFTDDCALELVLSPGEGGPRVVLQAFSKAGKRLATIDRQLPAAGLHGNLALVAHVPKTGRGGQFYFHHWQVQGEGLVGGPQQRWGPILFTQYTLSRQVLKLTAQLVPLGADDAQQATLECRRGEAWAAVAAADIDAMARTATFRVAKWDDTRDTPYRVVYRLRHRSGDELCRYEGVIRHDPKDRESIAVAGFTGNKDYAFPNREIVRNVARQDPDLLFFSGDQIYEDVGRYGIRRSPLAVATLDYLRKWYLFGWAFGDLTRNRPTVTLPDDHDVFQGNVWGQGGRPGTPKQGFSTGGYSMSPKWVNMVQRTQTSHLPDPYDPTPIRQAISVYYTDLLWGRISFAIIEDRKFKWGPNSAEAKAHPEQAPILGPRQLEFLRAWTVDWRGADQKVCLSQTIFAQAHTHGGKQNHRLKGDRDANGWPPQARDRALRVLRRGFAFMLAGDNHLPTVVQHGIDAWRDAGYCFTVPSIAAGFPRAWHPEEPGLNRAPGMPDYTGDFLDYHGNHITMWAVANPQVWNPKAGDLEVMDKKSSGYGLVRFHRPEGTITIECWRLLADLDHAADGQFPGWPVTISMLDNYGRQASAWLPTLAVSGVENPVVQVRNEADNEVVYTVRSRGRRFDAKVFAPGRYTVRVGEPDQKRWQTRAHVEALPTRGAAQLDLAF